MQALGAFLYGRRNVREFHCFSVAHEQVQITYIFLVEGMEAQAFCFEHGGGAKW